jgi:hypothetical protein
MRDAIIVRRRIAALVLLVTALVGAVASPAGAASTGPQPPTGLTATAVSATEVVLTWNPVDQASGYEVWWGDQYFSEYLATTTATTFRHTSLGPGGTYSYAVRTVTRKGFSPLSAFVTVQTPPQAPTLLAAEVVKADQVRLSWQPGQGALSYAISELAADGTERPSTVLDLQERGALVQTVADTHYTFRVRGVNGTLQSLDYGSVEISTPPREATVISLDSPSPVPAGDTGLSFSVVGQQSFQPPSGTLSISVDGGPVVTATFEQKYVTVQVRLVPGSHSLSADYSGDGAFLPSHADFTYFVAVTAPGFTAQALDPSDVSAAAAADVTCDGITDLISASRQPDGSATSLDVRPGQPDGTLGPVRATALPWAANSLAAADLNRDGCADVAVLGTDLLTYTGAPAGLVTGTRVRAGGTSSNLTLSDINRDGVPDAVVNTTAGVAMLPGNGRGGFGRSQTLVPVLEVYAVGDLDGDRLPDVVTSNGSGITAWGQSAAGQFTRRWSTGAAATAITVDDLTGDGRAEVVAAGAGVTVLSGQDGSQQGTVPGVYSAPQVITTGDVDGDGARDIVTMDGNWSIGVSLTWAGEPTALQYRRIDPYGVAPRGVLLADLSRDGRADVVALDYSYGLVLARQD